MEKITLAVEGKQKDDLNNPHDMNLQVELRLVGEWGISRRFIAGTEGMENEKAAS